MSITGEERQILIEMKINQEHMISKMDRVIEKIDDHETKLHEHDMKFISEAQERTTLKEMVQGKPSTMRVILWAAAVLALVQGLATLTLLSR